MSDVSMTASGSMGEAFEGHAPVRPKLDSGLNQRTAYVFFSVLAVALFFIAYSVYSDVTTSGVRTTSVLPYLLLGVALFIALGFELIGPRPDRGRVPGRRPHPERAGAMTR
jgi:hypothetical protein